MVADKLGNWKMIIKQNCMLLTFLMDIVNWKYSLFPGDTEREKVIYGIEDTALENKKKYYLACKDSLEN